MTSDESSIELLAGALSKLRDLGFCNRESISDVLRGTLKSLPRTFAVWMAWEPDAVDGRDRLYRNTPGHDDTGRFIPYWHRAAGTIQLEAQRGYDQPGSGDWYSFARRQGRICRIVDPFLHPIGGKPHWITSEFAPIVERGAFVGIVGIDHPAQPCSRRANALIPSACVIGQSVIAEKFQLLTTREREVHYWVCQGKSNEEIAVILDISANTVKNHLSPIFQKLGVENRYAAARLQPHGLQH